MPDISRFIRPAGMMEMRYVRLLSRLAFYQAYFVLAAAAACFALCSSNLLHVVSLYTCMS